MVQWAATHLGHRLGNGTVVGLRLDLLPRL